MHKLEEVKEQTIQKINYISDYFSKYINVIGYTPAFETINFFDCMSNAGMYDNNIKGTPIRIFELMIKYSHKFKEKKLNLFVNDLETWKIRYLESLIEEYGIENPNINVYYYNKDVNDFLELISSREFNSHFWKASSIIFVDPWNFGSVDMGCLTELLETRRVELVFNYMLYDYAKNRNNSHAPDKTQLIEDSLKTIGVDSHNTSPDELTLILKEKFLSKKHVSHVFYYPFKNVKNAIMYYLIYCTPHPKGLEKLKESLWAVFEGEAAHMNRNNQEQCCLFDLEDSKNLLEDYYYLELKPILMKRLSGIEISYDDIMRVALEQSMFKKGQVIKCVIRRMLDEGILIKTSDIRSLTKCKYLMRCRNE